MNSLFVFLDGFSLRIGAQVLDAHSVMDHGLGLQNLKLRQSFGQGKFEGLASKTVDCEVFADGRHVHHVHEFGAVVTNKLREFIVLREFFKSVLSKRFGDRWKGIVVNGW